MSENLITFISLPHSYTECQNLSNENNLNINRKSYNTAAGEDAL